MVSGLQSAWGFGLIGPAANGGDAWQATSIGYNPNAYIDTLPTGPKNIGEGYRRNTPVMYYTYDVNYLGYFGSNGEAAVDGAFANWNSLTNVDSYSAGLTEFPLDTQHINYTAQALGLVDLKSITMGFLAEQMGLAEPERYTWTLHAYDPTPFNGAKCPIDSEFLVVQRNYDILTSPLNQLQYSPYVNGTLYSYDIVNYCTTAASAIPPALAVTVPFPVDPFAPIYTAIASRGLNLGGFYNGLTRDDVAGLRYLYTTNDVNMETAAPGSLLTTSNLVAQPVLLTTVNLNALVLSSQTNDPVTLAGLFPGLVVGNSFNYFAVVATPNVVSYFTNYIGSPAGSPPVLVVTTNGYTYTPQTIYVTSFANVITNGNFTNSPGITFANPGIVMSYSSNTPALIATTTLSTPNGAPYGTPAITNTTFQITILTNAPSGEYFILPAGQCGWNIISTLLTNVTAITNIISTATNTVTTNATTGFVATQSIITYFTNHTYVAQAINCNSTAAGTGLYQGIENIKFVRADYDSLIGQFFQPITNNYTMVVVTNSKPVLQHFQRVVTAPDILFSASDLAGGSGNPITFNSYTRNLTFNQANVLPGLAGPGTIVPSTTITLNKVGDVFLNGSLALNLLTTNSFLSELTQGQSLLTWASFGASTNDPVVYPNGTSLQNLQNQMLIQVTPPPPTLPGGTNGMPYTTTTFTATGGAFSPPFTWGLPTGFVLPPGLTLTTTNSVGTLSGTPTLSGTFDFTIQLTDSLSRTVQWNYAITIQ